MKAHATEEKDLLFFDTCGSVCSPIWKKKKTNISSNLELWANRTKHLWQPKVKLDENGNIEKADIPSPLWLSQETFSMTAAAGGITRVKLGLILQVIEISYQYSN